jgi:tRNA (Thr-GGU) A37 N-methylase
MSKMKFSMKPIGVIHIPFKEKSGTPIQFSRSTAIGELELFPQYE